MAPKGTFTRPEFNLLKRLVDQIANVAEALDRIADNIEEDDDEAIAEHEVVVNRKDLAVVVDDAFINMSGMDEYPKEVKDAASNLQEALSDEQTEEEQC